MSITTSTISPRLPSLCPLPHPMFVHFVLVLFLIMPRPPRSILFPYTTLFRSMSLSHCIHQTLNSKASTRFHSGGLHYEIRSEERFSRNAETDLVCRLLLEKKKTAIEKLRQRRKRKRLFCH